MSSRSAVRDPAPTSRRTTWTAARKLVVFAAAALVLEALAFAMQLGGDVTPFVLVTIPAIGAVVVSWAGGGLPEAKALVSRLFVWRVKPRWYFAALGIPVVEKLVVDLAGVLLGASTPDRLLGAWSVSALLVPLVVVVPALLEELGWRGFGVQAAINAGRSPAWAALVIGLIFLMLHLPLYLPGHLYGEMPVWPIPLILLSSSVLLTWVYLRTSSALLAGLMHAAFNASVPLTWGLDPAWVWQARGVTLTVFAVALFVSRSFRLAGCQPNRSPTQGVRS